ncbi:hypothetical protein WMY93_027196 [Mugilogobius chulae]|uniref:E3 ubiquitin-protein ligase TRIM39-like n=1 Tax=Mugilogobius chulae TaxID=88201 RepID=A0AAW0N2G3_9GOBI
MAHWFNPDMSSPRRLLLVSSSEQCPTVCSPNVTRTEQDQRGGSRQDAPHLSWRNLNGPYLCSSVITLHQCRELIDQCSDGDADALTAAMKRSSTVRPTSGTPRLGQRRGNTSSFEEMHEPGSDTRRNNNSSEKAMATVSCTSLRSSSCVPSVWRFSLLQSLHHVDTTSVTSASTNTGTVVDNTTAQAQTQSSEVLSGVSGLVLSEPLQPTSQPRLKKHQLIQLCQLEERICPEHDRPLELFCREHSHSYAGTALMATVSCTFSEEQFLCSICLEIFTAPVTTSCGHNFCDVCINKHWNSSLQYNCPVCKQDFNSRPQIQVNTVLAEMVSQLQNKTEVREIVSSESKPAPPGEMDCVSAAAGEVDCDLCPEPRLRALKSCLVCLASYCQNHLQPHLTNPRLKKHQLIQPLTNLEERICPEHDRPLELFCREHSHFMCMQCSYTEHQKHRTVPLKEEGEEQQAALKDQIKERLQKIDEIRSSVELSQRKADTEIIEGLKVFNVLMECVQQSQDKFKQSIVEKHKEIEEEAAQLIEQIQTEISELEQRGAEMEQLWSSGDHLHFVQTFTSVKPAPQLNDWTEETVRAPSYKGRTAKAVSELKNMLNSEIDKVFKTEFEKVQEFSVEVSLDPNTANEYLVLSKDLKQVYDSDQAQSLPDNSERFSYWLSVLGKEKFSSEKFYFEVQVKGKTNWEIGVAKESVDRKDEDEKPQTVQRGFWLLKMDSVGYKTSEDPPVVFPVRSSPEKVGVFVDYDEGLVSFYDVDEQSLIYSFTDCFTENILPLFNPCDNSSVMATVSCTFSEEQLLCSICLEIFTAPVTTSCGHNFCKICINRHWDGNLQYNCPVCKQDFSSRPRIQVNTVLAEMVFEFRHESHDYDSDFDSDEETVSSEPRSAAAGEVDCDLCPEPSLRALKSCLVCLASYCQSHLQPHLTNPRLKKHQLIQPLPNLEEHICLKHNQPLELSVENTHTSCV